MKLQYVSEEQNNEVYIHVTFPESEAIMQDKDMVKDAFCICYNVVTKQAAILNEGFHCDYELTYSELAKVRQFYTTHKQSQHAKQ